jgi:hypothetical protein
VTIDNINLNGNDPPLVSTTPSVHQGVVKVE